jgi:DNA-binding MarR family transcriptional regulator
MISDQQKGLNKTQKEILEIVFEGQQRGQRRKQVQITEALNKGKSQISRKLKQLEDDKLIRRSKDGRSKRISLTNKGCKYLLCSRSNTSNKFNNLLNLHKFTVKFPIQNIEEIKDQRDDNWREEIIRDMESYSSYNTENDSYSVCEQSFTYWINRKHVIITLESLFGQDPYLLKDRAINKAISKAKEIEKDKPIELTDNYSGIRAKLSNEHLAIIGDPLSKLIHKTDYEGCDIKIVDEENRIRMWTDDSENRKDLEAGTQFGVHGFTEEDINKILEVYRSILGFKA